MGVAGRRAGGGRVGGIVEAAPEFRALVNAVRMHMDWRPVAGLGPDDAGSFVERTVAKVVLAAAVEAHNADMRKANRK